LITITTWSVVPGFTQAGLEERKVDAIMTLDLTRGPDALFKQFNKGRRSDITFASRNGVDVREAASEEDFKAYYDIYSGWCRRKQIEPLSYDVMRNAMSLRSNRRLFMAFHESKAIAGSVVRFAPSGVAEYSANNSLESALPLRPNSLLNWVAIQWACAEGLRTYSMGGSHPFLRHFGGLEIPIYRYRIDRTAFKIHDRRDWAAAKIRSIARVVRNRLKRTERSK
jgi:lipid II:glycine glycyltransferase (peptidoglycan interpeptide bridge formation enzyme)